MPAQGTRSHMLLLLLKVHMPQLKPSPVLLPFLTSHLAS